MRNIARARAGFTIVEVVLAMGILLFGMSSILGLLTFGAALSRTAHLRTNAASAVEAVTADLEETLFPMVKGEAGEPKKITQRDLYGTSEIVYSATPVQNPDRPLEYRVDVEMTWKSAGLQREKRFSTILLREVPFGERLRRRFVEGEEDALPSAPPGATAGGAAQDQGTNASPDDTGDTTAPARTTPARTMPADERGASSEPRKNP